MSDYNIAVYIRLSNADEDTGSGKDESNSIVHQRMLLNRYLDSRDDLKAYPRFEFVDDGFSGTNTDRPSFQKMIAQVKQGAVNLICVKDFSRFSRDYIEIGDYLECLFPFLHVRFISVNDGYDSFDYKGTTGGLDVVMRNIVYAAYSKDLSVKVRTARDQRKKKGQYVDCNTPIGYERDPVNKHKLVIDPEGAVIVRRIYELACKGLGCSQIALKMNEEGYPTPAAYYQKRRPGTRQDHSVLGNRWSYSSVYIILNRYSYTGAMVSNRTLNTAPCSKKRRTQPKDNWIIVEDQHPAIISKETYEQAQKIIRNMTLSAKKSKDYSLRSLVRCGCCKRLLARHGRENSRYYLCRYRTDAVGKECMNVRVNSEKELERIAQNAITLYISSVEANEKERKTFMDSRSARTQELMDQLARLQKQQEHLKTDKLRQYEGYASGLISKEMYMRNKNSFDEKLLEISSEVSAIESQMSQIEQRLPYQISMEEELSDRFAGAQELTNEMARAFIDAIYVFPDDQITIQWKYRDVFADNRF